MLSLQNIKNMSNDIRYLTPINIDIKKQKYCRFKKSGIKFVDFKDPNFLLKLINEQGKILPRRITGTSAKYQNQVNKAIKRARHLAILPPAKEQAKKEFIKRRSNLSGRIYLNEMTVIFFFMNLLILNSRNIQYV